MRLTALIVILLIVPTSYSDALCQHEDPKQVLACFDRLSLCAATTDDSQRLACFRAGGPQPSSMPASVSGQSQPESAQIEQAFPVAGATSGDSQNSPVLSAKVVRAERNAYQYYYIWLDNGHIWREKEKSRFRYKVGDAVTISKGALGSNQLKVEGRTGMALVERVK